MAIWWATLRHNPHQGGGRWLAVMSHEWDQVDEHDDASTWFCTAFHQKTRHYVGHHVGQRRFNRGSDQRSHPR
jgi:predicted HD phosphohydrolase